MFIPKLKVKELDRSIAVYFTATEMAWRCSVSKTWNIQLNYLHPRKVTTVHSMDCVVIRIAQIKEKTAPNGQAIISGIIKENYRTIFFDRYTVNLQNDFFSSTLGILEEQARNILQFRIQAMEEHQMNQEYNRTKASNKMLSIAASGGFGAPSCAGAGCIVS